MSRLRVLGIVALTFAGAFAGAVACSTFSDGDTTADEDGGTAEGSTPSDAAFPDAALPVDDAAAPEDAAWIPCSMRATKLDPKHFCDDFDRGGAVSAAWDGPVTQNGGALQLVDGGLSAPNAYRAFVPTNTSLPGRAQLMKTATPPTASYRVAFDVRIDSIPHDASVKSGYVHVLGLSFDDATCLTGTNKARAVEFSFYAQNESVTVVEKGLETCPPDGGAAPSTSDRLLVTPTQLVDGRFHHVAVELSRNKCPGSVKPMALRFSFDGEDNACRPLGADVFAESSKITAYLGVFIGEAAYAQTAFVYDNVTIDYE